MAKKVKKASAKKKAKAAKSPGKTKGKKKVVKKAAKKIAKKSAKKGLKKATKKKTNTVNKSKTPAKKMAKAKTKKMIASKNIRKTNTKLSVPKAQNDAPMTDVHFTPHQTKLKAGDKAPFIGGYDQNGNLLDASKYSGFKIALYFYPKDDTPGCTKQACSLRDNIDRIGRQGFKVIGVSADDVESHRKFAFKHRLNFPLIADVNKQMIEAYDVWGLKKLYGRVYEGIVRTTFLIGEDGNILEVISNIDVENHHKQIKTSNN